MVWAHNKINRTCKDDATRHGIRRRKKGRQKNRWVDNIILSEWTGLKLGESLRKAENREK